MFKFLNIFEEVVRIVTFQSRPERLHYDAQRNRHVLDGDHLDGRFPGRPFGGARHAFRK